MFTYEVNCSKETFKKICPTIHISEVWDSKSINVEVPEDWVDEFAEKCEDNEIEYRLI